MAGIPGESWVGPYRILRLIEHGGQGSVYLGYDGRLHRRVAIKIYPLPARRAQRRLLLREARLVAGIHSAKVVQVYDVIESSAHLAMVMEYVPGCSLEDFLGGARPSLASVLTVGIDVAGALALARQRHIVHGDLKAANVLIGENGRARLTDFGIARKTGSATGRWGPGSLSALSPEQYLGEPMDERSDLFALGSLLYRMLSGEQPFFTSGRLDADRLLRGQPTPLAEVVAGSIELPQALVELVQALLEKDPERRPPTTRRVRHVLRSALRNLPMSASGSLLREARPWFRPELPEDIPPRVPLDLAGDFRSRLLPVDGRISRLLYPLRILRWPARFALAAIAVAALSAPIMLTLRGTTTPVRFDELSLVIDRGVRLPGGVGRSWLLATVKGALEQRYRNLFVVGELGAIPATTLYSHGAGPEEPQEARQAIRLALHCHDKVCVFTIRREEEGRQSSQQGVLMTDMDEQLWRDIVHETTLALYR